MKEEIYLPTLGLRTVKYAKRAGKHYVTLWGEKHEVVRTEKPGRYECYWKLTGKKL